MTFSASTGFRSAARLRHPPGRRARPSGSAPESSSVTPSATVASWAPQPARPAGSRYAPAPGPPLPAAAAAAADPDAALSTRTSRPASPQEPRLRPYHIRMPDSGKLQVIARQALRSLPDAVWIMPTRLKRVIRVDAVNSVFRPRPYTGLRPQGYFSLAYERRWRLPSGLNLRSMYYLISAQY